MEVYKTLGGDTTASLVEKKSEFIALAAFVDSEAKALEKLGAVRSAHPKARHTAYAYQLREGTRCRHSDDGEPSKTAGLPILSVIQGMGLTDCLMAVTRYFGGTLLGTGGLVRCYGGAAKLALEAATIVTMRSCVPLQIKMGYPYFETVRHLLEKEGAKLEPPTFAEDVTLCALVTEEQAPAVTQILVDATNNAVAIHMEPPVFLPF